MLLFYNMRTVELIQKYADIYDFDDALERLMELINKKIEEGEDPGKYIRLIS